MGNPKKPYLTRYLAALFPAEITGNNAEKHQEPARQCDRTPTMDGAPGHCTHRRQSAAARAPIQDGAPAHDGRLVEVWMLGCEVVRGGVIGVGVTGIVCTGLGVTGLGVTVTGGSCCVTAGGMN